MTVTTLTDTITYTDPPQVIGPISCLEHRSAGARDHMRGWYSARCQRLAIAGTGPDQTVTCTFAVTLSGTAQIVSDVVNVVVVDNELNTAPTTTTS